MNTKGVRLNLGPLGPFPGQGETHDAKDIGNNRFTFDSRPRIDPESYPEIVEFRPLHGPNWVGSQGSQVLLT